MQPSIAVVIPCYNEAKTIAGVVAGFRASLPQARLIVFDNASSDDTAAIARAAGAEVIFEPRRGKGNAVRRMFAEIDADVLIMVDGDGTYDASAAPHLIERLFEARADMLIATRASVMEDAGRRGHAFGNQLFNHFYRMLFGRDYTDIFSGYRVFSRRFVKSFPAVSAGFEIETEMAVHASELRLPIIEVVLPYGRRPEGSHSKLSTFRDGFKILATFVRLFKHIRPLAFYGACGVACASLALILATPLILTWLESGLVPRLPTAVLVMGLSTLSALFAACGLILESVAAGRIEYKRLAYLAQPNLFESQAQTFAATAITPAPSAETIPNAAAPAPRQRRTDPANVDWVKLREELRRAGGI